MNQTKFLKLTLLTKAVASLLNIIFKQILLSTKCTKILVKDGISSQDLVIQRMPGLFEGISINMKKSKVNYPDIGDTASILKNLDHYQFAICTEIPGYPDAAASKLLLQKYRIVIIASIVKLVKILNKLNLDASLKEWNMFAKILLMEASDTLVYARTNSKNIPKSKNIRLQEALSFFDIDESRLDVLLTNMY